MAKFPHRYLEEIVLTVLFWVGLWGAISLLLDHICSTWIARFAVYIFLVIGSFTMLHLREHIPQQE